jgi:hypothetical protein
VGLRARFYFCAVGSYYGEQCAQCAGWSVGPKA